MLYNLSEFLEMLKEDMGVSDLPLPVNDQDLIKRLDNSALKIFSQFCPRIEMGMIGEENRIQTEIASRNIMLIYRIPQYLHEGSELMGITGVEVARPMGYSDYYVPSGMHTSPVSALESLADIKMSAALAQATSKAPTGRFVSPDILYIYNGWAGGTYMVSMWLKHDISLSTIPDTAMYDFQRLARLDLEEYLYNRLKRKESLDVGIGSIQLKLDEWQGSQAAKADLLREWKDDFNLDIDQATYF